MAGSNTRIRTHYVLDVPMTEIIMECRYITYQIEYKSRSCSTQPALTRASLPERGSGSTQSVHAPISLTTHPIFNQQLTFGRRVG
jgi:hypothetical protein